MSASNPEDENQKLNDPQELRANKKKTTEKHNKTMTTSTRATTFDLTKANSPSTGIIDIRDDPDVAVWSKGIMQKTKAPADKVVEPHYVKSTITNIKYREEEGVEGGYQRETVDPANKAEVAKAIDLGASLTDEGTNVIKRSKRQISSDD